MKKTLVSLLLLLLALTMVLCSCQNSNDPNEPDTTPTDDGGESESESTEQTGVPVVDYSINGSPREVVLLTFGTYNTDYHFFANDMEGDALHVEAFERTSYINEQYGVDLVAVNNANTACDALFNSEQAGGGDYDLVYPHPDISWYNAITMGYLTDLTKCEYINFEGPWWNQSQVENYKIAGKLFFAASDFSLSGQGFAAMIYNRKLMNDLTLDKDIYDVVKDGEWTMEKLNEMVKLYGNDVNEDPENALYGLMFQTTHSMSLHVATGLNFTERDDTGNFAVTISTEKVNGVATKLYDILYNNGDRVMTDTSNYGTFAASEGWAVFQEQRALFMTYDIGALYRYLQPLEFEIGYLPLPMYDEDQDDYKVMCAAGFFCIPAHADDPEMSGLLLEALSVYSYENYRPEFFNTILLGRLSKQQKDYDMLEFLHEHKTYYIGFTFGGGAYQVLRTVVVDGKSTNTQSYMRNKYNNMMESVTLLENLRQHIEGLD